VKHSVLLTTIVCLGSLLPAQAQTPSPAPIQSAPPSPSSPPIQIGLDQLASKAKETVNITLDAAMLQLAGKFLASGKSDDSKFKKIVTSLRALCVKRFQFPEEGLYRQEDLDPVRTQLQSPGWSKLIGNRNPRESSEIYTKSDGTHITGLAVLAAQPKELTVVYIEGALLNLSDLADLAGHFGIPGGLLPGSK
jgi:hypothetical protein